MEQKEKDLLFKDLCERFPYGVKIQYSNQICNLVTIDDDYTVLLLGEDGYKPNIEDDLFLDIENVKPYLRPMSSMTEEEKEDYIKVCELDTEILSKHPMDETPFPALYNSQDWLDKNMFDYRGLIEMGLALEAPEGMYN